MIVAVESPHVNNRKVQTELTAVKPPQGGFFVYREKKNAIEKVR
jgi:hypothetical protein